MAIEETEVAARRRLVLDANILVRGILGSKVSSLLETYEDTVVSTAPISASRMRGGIFQILPRVAASIPAPDFGCSISGQTSWK